MAGDPLRDAFRSELATVATEQGVDWDIEDLENTGQNPDLQKEGFLALEFPGGSEEQFTTGAPGNNLFDENGQVTVRVYARRGISVTLRDLAETYGRSIRNGFRGRRFSASDGTSIRITDVAPMGDGQDEAGRWSQSVAIGYQVFNTG